MNTLLVHTVLAASPDDFSSWVEMLIFVIVLVFWALGGILKLKSARKSNAEIDEQSEPEPSSRLSGPVFIQQPTRKKVQRQPEPAVAPLLKKDDLGLTGKWETDLPEVSIETLLQFEDPDDLKRAILHYEILGKPLALRQQS